jgi:hypothetical protein
MNTYYRGRSEHISMVATRREALIRVWQRDPQCGSIVVHDVPVAREFCLKLEKLDLFIDKGVEQQLRALRTATVPSETGGVLLGYYDFNISAVIVVGALPAPPDSISSAGSFERGVAGLEEGVREASRRNRGNRRLHR